MEGSFQIKFLLLLLYILHLSTVTAIKFQHVHHSLSKDYVEFDCPDRGNHPDPEESNGKLTFISCKVQRFPHRVLCQPRGKIYDPQSDTCVKPPAADPKSPDSKLKDLFIDGHLSPRDFLLSKDQSEEENNSQNSATRELKVLTATTTDCSTNWTPILIQIAFHALFGYFTVYAVFAIVAMCIRKKKECSICAKTIIKPSGEGTAVNITIPQLPDHIKE